MTDTPYLTRAREWYASNVRSRINWTEEDETKVSDLAALLMQVRNEALEEAALVCDSEWRRVSKLKPSSPHERRRLTLKIVTCRDNADDIRSLKEPRQ